ncbi:MAG: glycosyltransferase family 2 protein [Candidatus Hydrogenedentes bacterium]|nr:glycosyltransferase family 2 protein [Candidatus Hydrogenedentota bacterium]
MRGDTYILLPAYNEGEHIADVIAGAREAMPDTDIVVIDDGSADTTALNALEAGAIVVPHPFNMGYGVALQTGYKFALANGAHYVVQMDSDGQHDPAGLARLLERVRSGHCDLCVGSRFLEGRTYSIPMARRLGMVFFRRVASYVLGQTITDPTSGFQAMNRRVLEFFAKDLYPGDYPDTDVLVLLHHHGFRIIEIPVVMRESRTGKSIHSGFKPVYYLFKMALDIPLNLLRREH